MTNSKHFGYWVFGKDMNNVNLKTLKNNGVTDIFLNYYAFTTNGESKTLSWIKEATNNKINIHIWVQCFYDGEWHNPKTYNTTSKLKEIKKYIKMDNIKGIHLDYLRYPGNAYKTSGGAEAITNFVKNVRSLDSKIFLSCAVMPENESKYYYGQDIDALGKIVDAILPMQYKGNYQAGTSWLKSTTKSLSSKATIWSGLQTYKSDDNVTQLSSSELLNDAKTCLDNGAKGVILFRYGVSPNINFTSLQPKQTTTTKTTTTKAALTVSDIKKIATTVKDSVNKDKKIPANVTINKVKYNWAQVWYILSYAINNLNKDLTTVPNTKNADKTSGSNINEKIYKSDFKDQAKRIIQYIKQNGKAPAYVTTVKSKTKVKPRVCIDAFARIILWYYNHNKTLPKYATYKSERFTTTTTKTTTTTTTKSTTSTKLNSYMTSEGCSGMGQCTGYTCGCNSLQQCFYRLTGIKVSESTIAEVAGTTTAGTDHDGLNTTVVWFNKKYNKNIKITWKNFSDLGSSDSARWKALQQYIDNGAVFVHLLYRDQWGHYEVPKSVGDSSLSILNSLGDYCSYPAYCGYIETRSKGAQLSYINGISQKSIAILTNG